MKEKVLEMSKLQKQAVASQVLIWVSLASVVWLWSDYLCHHWVVSNDSNPLLPHKWIGNPNYKFTAGWLWFLGILLVFGLVGQYSCWREGFRWSKSSSLAKVFERFGSGLLAIALGISTLLFFVWLSNGNSGAFSSTIDQGHFNWRWSMWWCVIIGWSALGGVFCLIQSSRAFDAKAEKIKRQLKGAKPRSLSRLVAEVYETRNRIAADDSLSMEERAVLLAQYEDFIFEATNELLQREEKTWLELQTLTMINDRMSQYRTPEQSAYYRVPQ